jgi:hypothetical protein
MKEGQFERQILRMPVRLVALEGDVAILLVIQAFSPFGNILLRLLVRTVRELLRLLGDIV